MCEVRVCLAWLNLCGFKSWFEFGTHLLGVGLKRVKGTRWNKDLAF